MTLVLDPLLPVWAFMSCTVIALLLAGLSLYRNWKSGVFRAIALLALFALLANPMLREAERTSLDDVALILIDKSASQNLDQRSIIRNMSSAWLKRIARSLELSPSGFHRVSPRYLFLVAKTEYCGDR